MHPARSCFRRLPAGRSFWLLLWLWCCLPVAAQPAQQIATGFERDVNRYRWTSDVVLAQQVGRWQIRAANRFASDAFILFSDQLSFRDENQLSLGAERPFNDRFRLVLQGRGAWYSLSRVFSQESYAGLRYTPQPYAWIEPMVGVATDRRPGAVLSGGSAPLRTDTGPAYGVRLGLTPPPINDYVLSLEGVGTWQLITPRRGRAVRLRSAAERAFEGTHLASSVSLSTFRRDAYQAASFLNRDGGTRLSETVEATTSDTLQATLDLTAPVYAGFLLTGHLDFAANNRAIRTLRAPDAILFFDSDFNRRAVEAEIGVQYEDRRYALRLSASGGAEVERRRLDNADDLPAPQAAQKSALLQQADYDRGFFTLQARTRASLHRLFTLTFDGSANILRHDTPDLNPDDRDELYYNGLAGLLMRFSRYVQMDLKLFGTSYHTVYLKSSRSAENNVQRSLRLRPTVQWTPARHTTIRLSSEVRATYTIDDFILPGRRSKDQSAREVRYDAELTRDFGRGLRILASGSLSDLRLGRFLSDAFAEIPFDTLRTQSGWLRLQTGDRVTAEIGLRILIRSDYDRAATVRYDRVDEAGIILRDETGAPLRASITRMGRETIEQVGPTCALSWPMRRNASLRLDGWLTVQHVRQTLYGDLPEASADQIRRAGRKGMRKFIPNLAVLMLWNF